MIGRHIWHARAQAPAWRQAVAGLQPPADTGGEQEQAERHVAAAERALGEQPGIKARHPAVQFDADEHLVDLGSSPTERVVEERFESGEGNRSADVDPATFVHGVADIRHPHGHRHCGQNVHSGSTFNVTPRASR